MQSDDGKTKRKTHEKMKKSFVVSDESINSYGFRVLTEGIDIKDFEKNPIMLWNHTRTWTDKDNAILPIGRWENLRIEDGKLIADPVFDMEDPFAAKIAKKVEKGIINMCSIGIVVNEESDSSKYVIQGQTRKTVTKCKLREVSIVDIGSNANAVALYDDDGNVMELTADGKCAVGIINNNKNDKNMNLKEIALKLGLSENATEAEVNAKIAELKEGKVDPGKSKEKELTDRIAVLEQEKKEAAKKAIENLVDSAISEKKITADKKAHFLSLGEKVGIDELKVTLSCMNQAVKPTDIIVGGKGTATEKKYSELSEKELSELRDKDRDAYCVLYEKEFGFKPELD